MEIGKSPGVRSKWPVIVGEGVCHPGREDMVAGMKTPEEVMLSVRKQSLPTK